MELSLLLDVLPCLKKTSLIFSSDFKFHNSMIIEPPKKINKVYYRCCKQFNLDTISEMFKNETKIGIILISGSGYKFYVIIKTGSHLDVRCLDDGTIKLQKNQKKGGQSAQRIERIKNEKDNNYIKKVSEKAIKSFMIVDKSRANIDTIILSGPASRKKELYNNSTFKQFLGPYVSKFVNTREIDKVNPLTIYNKSLDVILNQHDKNVMKLVGDIEDLINIGSDKLIFGIDETISNMESCMIKSLLINSNLDNGLKQQINELNTYDCEILEFDSDSTETILIDYDVVGVRWY
jgi:peptide subunit release factor 1 (eRF1)